MGAHSTIPIAEAARKVGFSLHFEELSKEYPVSIAVRCVVFGFRRFVFFCLVGLRYLRNRGSTYEHAQSHEQRLLSVLNLYLRERSQCWPWGKAFVVKGFGPAVMK